jgi:hypothetical protein
MLDFRRMVDFCTGRSSDGAELQSEKDMGITLSTGEIPAIKDMDDALRVRDLPPIYEGKPSGPAELAERMNNPLVQQQSQYKNMAEAYIRQEAEKFTREVVANIQAGTDRDEELMRLVQWNQKYKPKRDPMDDSMSILMG